MHTRHTPFSLYLPLVLNAPHSGANYSEAFLKQSRLSLKTLRKVEDMYVDELFLNEATPSLKANFPRSYLDVNRAPYELDPLLIEGELPSFAYPLTAKTKVGLGTVPRLAGEGKAIYEHKLLLETALNRIETLYFPYHAALYDLLETVHHAFGQAFLLDCHSMPALATRFNNADIVLGDNYGQSCTPDLTHCVQSFFEEKGYRVALNTPFAGGFITQHYGKPSLNYHALQIEISRKLYVNEQTFEKTKGFLQLQSHIQELIKKELPQRIALEV
jgi:N-formylglutamate amidohydrolase